jgi:hypothetical protein|eukprot:scaffold1332_cov197-Alexandrium_tamarense.AAC.34
MEMLWGYCLVLVRVEGRVTDRVVRESIEEEEDGDKRPFKRVPIHTHYIEVHSNFHIDLKHGTIKAINSPWLVVLSVRTTVTVDGRVEVIRRKEEDDENDNPTYNQHKYTPISLFQLILKNNTIHNKNTTQYSPHWAKHWASHSD